ncbi:MAG: diguanylate cyclase [Angelakisella sp.]
MKCLQAKRILLLPIAFMMLTLVFLFDFSVQNENFIKQNIYEELRVSALQQNVALNTKFEEHFRVLNAYASYLEDYEQPDVSSITNIGKYVAKSGEFARVALAYAHDGIAHFDSGATLDVSARDYYKNGLLGLRSVDRVFSPLSNSWVFVFSLPIYMNGDVSAVLIGSYEANDFSHLLESKAHDSSSYSFMVDSTGQVIISANHENYLTYTNNILDFFSKATLFEGVTVAGIADDLKNQRGNTIHYELANQTRYATYFPIQLNDWYIFSVVPGEVLDIKRTEASSFVFQLVVKMVITSIILIAGILLYDTRKNNLLNIEKNRYRIAEEVSESVIFEGNYRDGTLRFNPNYYKLFGREPALHKISDFGHAHPYVIKDDVPSFLEVGQGIVQGKAEGIGEYRVEMPDGTSAWHQLVFKTMFDHYGKPDKCIGVILSIDRQKKEVSNLQKKVDRDHLTGLLNRMAFESYVTAFLRDGAETGTHALLILDIDNFKKINDTYGHMEGDKSLKCFADIFLSNTRTTDFVGRIGGDEFFILLKNINSDNQLAQKSKDICNAISGYKTGIEGFQYSCSIGVCVFSRDAKEFDELYRKADEALYVAKNAGKNQFKIWNN